MNQEMKGQLKLVKGSIMDDCLVTVDLKKVSFIAIRDGETTSLWNPSLFQVKEGTPDSVIPYLGYAGVVIIHTVDERPPVVILTDDDDIFKLIKELQDKSTLNVEIQDIHGMSISLHKDFISAVEIPHSDNRFMALGVEAVCDPEFPNIPDFILVFGRYCDGMVEQRTSEECITLRPMKLESWKRRCRERRCFIQ